MEVFKWLNDILSVQLDPKNVLHSEDDEMILPTFETQVLDTQTLSFEDIISNILLFTLQCLNSEDDRVQAEAQKVNELLQTRILDVVKIEKSRENTQTFTKILDTLQNMITTENNASVKHAMGWIKHLIDNFPTELTQLSEKIIKNLNNEDLQIVEISVKLIAKIVNKQDSCELISDILTYLEENMRKETNQTRSLSILKTLFSHIEGEKLLTYFAKSLRGHTNKEFKINMVQNLDLVINIEEELYSLRSQLKEKSNPMFDSLFEIWCADPISCVSLCLLGEQYHVAYKVIQLMAYANMNVNMLVRLAQVTKLLDMPHYAALRMQLLRPKK